MTRTDNDTAISNKERAELATREAADITVRIHANSDGSSQAAERLPWHLPLLTLIWILF